MPECTVRGMPSGPIIDIDPTLCDTVIGRQLPSWLQSFLSDVAGDAFIRCPQGTPDPLGRPPKFATALRYTINTVMNGTGVEVQGFVQANSPYAFFVHEGTRAHEIPTGGAAAQIAKGYRLRYSKDGTVRMPWSVMHPGTTAQPFLKDALVTVGGATLRAAA